MLALATLCVLVGTSLAAAVGGMPDMNGGGMMMPDGNNMTTPPTHMCCMPKQWEATMVELNQNADKNGNMYALRFAHDDVSMRDGYYVSKVGPGDDRPIMQVFKDFVDKKTYTVNMTAMDPRGYTCTMTANNEHFYGGCTQKDSTVTNVHYIGDATIGPEKTGIKYDGWSFKTQGMDIIMSLARDGCVPLLESVKSAPGAFPEINQLYMYNDVVPMIVTKELLTIPAACVNTASAVIG